MKHMTIGILAHVDAGKTTLTEALLYRSGMIRSQGRVDKKDAFLDTDTIERERGITIFSKQARIRHQEAEITILDTPGHVDFAPEAERTLQVLDLAILVISGTSGVQGHTKTIWRLLEHYKVPVILFVNKMDMTDRDSADLIREIQESLSEDCMDFSSFRQESLLQSPLPSTTLFSEAQGDDPDFLEALSLSREEMMNRLLEEGTVALTDIQTAIGQRKCFPVYFGSALKLTGTETFLHALITLAPSPEVGGEFGARVYKIGRDHQGNRMTFLKVTGGSLKVRQSLSYQDRKGETRSEKVNDIRLYSGEKYELRDSVDAGEVCTVTGLSATYPGQGIGSEPPGDLPVLEPVLNYSLILPDYVNASEFYRNISVLEEEEPELHLLWNEENGSIQVQMMGQVQIEVLTRMIADRFNVPVSFGPGRIVYKETVVKPVEGVGHFEPLRHYAEVHLLLEPAERGSGIQVKSLVSEDELELHWQRLIQTHLTERDHPGVLTGSALTDVTITIVGGRANTKHTEGGDFRQATYRAVRQGLKSTETTLLEPYYSFTLEIPDDQVGRALTDLSERKGFPGAPEFFERSGKSMAKITGRVPVSTMNEYIHDVNIYTRGEGSLLLIPAGYDVCHNPEEVIQSFAYDSERDTANPTGSVFCAHGSGFPVPWDRVPAYMHLPYRFVPDAHSKAYEENDYEDGFSSANSWGRSRGGSSDTEDLEAIYRREFGRSSEQEIRQEQRREEKNRSRAGRTRRQKVDKKGNPIYPKKDQREDFLIIDGYNIIFSWKELSKLKDTNIDAARDRLLEEISNYQGYTGRKITVVFDAYKVNRTPQTIMQYDNLEIVFTQKEETADAYIERRVHEEADKYQITVATSDALEQLTVMRLGALRMSASMLAEEVSRITGRKDL